LPPEPPRPLASPKRTISQAQGGETPDRRPEDPPVLKHEEAAPGESERERMPPEPEIPRETLPQVAQVAPAAASKEGGEPARAIPQGGVVGEGDARAAASLEDGLETLKHLTQEVEAQESFALGVFALGAGQWLDAAHDFSDTILAVDYRNTDIARQAAKQLDGALRMLRDRGYAQDQTVREARIVLKEFRSRMKRAPRPPAGKR
jgi:hypothetical protein